MGVQLFSRRGALALGAALALCGYGSLANAITFEWDGLGGITGALNTNFTLGAQIRLEDPDPDIVSIGNQAPGTCRSLCQPHLSTAPGDIPGKIQLGLEAEGNFVNQLGINQGGAHGANNDEGTNNFDQWDITQAPLALDQDLLLEFGDRFGGHVRDLRFFGRINAFYDFENYNRKQRYPNYYTEEDRARDDAMRAAGNYGFASVGSEVSRENGSKYDELLGRDIDVLDFYVQGQVSSFGLLDSDLSVTIGEQIINWGESTIISINSLNTINPINLNALFRPGFLSLATVFQPVGAIKIGAPLSLNTSLDIFYQYDWEKVEIAPRGGFLSFVDVTLGASDNTINPLFGQGPDDPEGNLRAEQQLLTAIANVSGRIPVTEENAEDGGQYGAAFTWFLPDFNNGTELRFYYANYHSRLPYISAYAGNESCLQATPTRNALVDTASLISNCPNLDFAHFFGAIGESVGGDAGGQLTQVGNALNAANLDQAIGQSGAGVPCPADAAPGTGPCAEAYDLDSFRVLLEYPEDINLYGISFNTSFGDISVQGEVAYRPNLPLQVDDVDVAFAALQPAAPRGCAGENASDSCQPGSFDDEYVIGASGITGLIGTLGSGSNVVGAIGDTLGVDLGQAQAIVAGLETAFSDAGLDAGALAMQLSNLGIPSDTVLADPPGRRNAFPDFLNAYSGRDPGNIQPGQYIQGYKRMDVIQYNLGATYVIGPGNWLKADQIIMLFELGANHVPNLPNRKDLQIEGPGTFNHASVGNDGSGAQACPEGTLRGDSGQADGGQANSTVCGQFQLRFNPTQQQKGFADEFSAGYRIISFIRYENVYPGISFQPVVVIWHDFYNTAPGPGEPFIEGRQIYVVNLEVRYQSNWTLVAGATFFRGAGQFNLLNDRDFAQLAIRYRF
jgi:hypothetical protein